MQKSPNFICANIIKVSSALFSLAVCLTTYPSFAAKVKCNAGEYLPANSSNCQSCDNLDFGRLVCPGGDYSTDTHFNRGVFISVVPPGVCMPGYFLPAGKSPSSSNCIECTKTNISAEISKLKRSYNEFMERTIKNTEDSYISMTKFLSRFEPPSDVDFYLGDVRGLTMTDIDSLYCPGARTVYKDKDVPGGLEVCNKTVKSVGTMNRIICGEEEQQTTTETTEPVFFYSKVNTSGLVGIGKATCNAGQVWDNGKCVSCTSKSELVNYANENRMYCAGVKNISVIGLQLQDQLTKCPAGMWPNSELSDCECGYGLETTKEGKCVGSLSYTDMYYGPSGLNAPLYKQCWTKSYDSKAYKKCMGFD